MKAVVPSNKKLISPAFIFQLENSKINKRCIHMFKNTNVYSILRNGFTRHMKKHKIVLKNLI
jgi:hypothetical protein